MSESSQLANPTFTRDLGNVTPDVQPELNRQPVQDRASESASHLPIHLYERENGRPLVTDILDIGTVYKHIGMGQEVKAIDQHILEEINRRNWKPTEGSYHRIYDEMFSELQIDPNINFTEVLPQMATWAAVLERTYLEKQIKEQLNV